MTAQNADVVRLSVNLSPDVAAVLHELMEKRGTTATETIRRAISVLYFLETETENGGELLLREPGIGLVPVALMDDAS
ncbi:hypothetical protein [Nocardia wallacei]|uniref:hypothetical protein n=1 Tax=Nocardia wallacei TaxID=480035 RepID=UPI002453F727|nr:hypothetical protein [Nocardia wallacei]